jgi:hypothetical protein
MKDDLIVYDITVDPRYAKNGQSLEIEQIAFVTQPAVLTKGFAFEAKPFMFKDDVKMRIAAPALIPMTIYRNDEFGEYYVRFSEEVIEELHMKLMKNLQNKGVFNTEHDASKEAPAYILEAWLVGKDPKKDRSYSEFGIEVPKGTLFMVAQVTDKAYYDQLVKDGRTGFSIEGFLGMKLSEMIKSFKDANLHPNCRCEIVGGELITQDGVCDYCLEIKRKEYTKTKTMKKFAKKKMKRFKATRKFVDDAEVVESGELTVIAEEIAVDEEIVVIDENLEIVEDFTGELIVEDEIIVVEEGTITEVVEIVSEEMKEDEEKEKMEEVVEEEKEEIKMQIDETELMTILQPKFEEVYAMIADLKNLLESEEEEEEIETPTEMSVHERFKSAIKFCKDNY